MIMTPYQQQYDTFLFAAYDRSVNWMACNATGLILPLDLFMNKLQKACQNHLHLLKERHLFYSDCLMRKFLHFYLLVNQPLKAHKCIVYMIQTLWVFLSILINTKQLPDRTIENRKTRELERSPTPPPCPKDKYTEAIPDKHSFNFSLKVSSGGVIYSSA